VADGAGNLYVADQLNHSIRKVVVATGVVTTVAGDPNQFGITDGVGPAARFQFPVAQTWDGAGNLYVADVCTIRKVVVATGAVTTLAGTSGTCGTADGVGTAAQFNFPQALAIDGAGNLYIADTMNRTIRKMVVATGAVSTLAGTPGTAGSTDGIGAAALFNEPKGITVDGAGNVYVGDTFNGTIRKLVVATGVVTTLAGDPKVGGSTDGIGAAAHFYHPSGITADGAGNLYVADTDNHTIRQVVVATGAVTTLAGTAGMTGSDDGVGAAARFFSVYALALDGAGNLYIGDETIRRLVLAAGAVTTVVGTETHSGSTDGPGAVARFNQPRGVAADAAGNLYVADTINSTIRQVSATGTVRTLAGTPGMAGSTDGVGAAARFGFPSGVAVDGAGNLYVSDGNAIRQVVVATGAVTTLAGAQGMLGSTDGVGAAARFFGPSGLALDAAGNLYVADTDNNTIRKVVVATGAVTTLAGTAGQTGNTDGIGTAARFYHPSNVAADAAGNLYVVDSANYKIRKVVVASGAVTTLAPAPFSANAPPAVAADGAGNLYITDWSGGMVSKLQLSTGKSTTFVGVSGQHGVLPGPLPARLNGPLAVATLPTGGIIISDENALLLAH
jgi:sugar lactone lactonase YvrE